MFGFVYLLQIASLLKIPFLDEEVANNSFPRKVHKVKHAIDLLSS